MFQVKLMLAFCAALSLSACQTPAPVDIMPVPQPIATASPACSIVGNTLADEKALYGAEAAYNVVADAYLTLDAKGQLTPSLKASARLKLLLAYDALKVARSARLAANACTFGDAISQLGSLVGEVKAILPNI